jgi:hypothetical protein
MIEANIFDRFRRSSVNARRRPSTNNAVAPTNNSKFAQGKSRVVGNQTKIKK